EEVLGGAAGDSFTGNGSDNFFGGGGGNDTAKGQGGNDDLTGSTGSDSLEGNDGDDFLQAKNNDVDTVKGGTNSADFDLAEVDGIDVGARPIGSSLVSIQATGLDRSQLDPSYNADDPTYGGGLNTGPDLNWDAITASAVDSQGRVVIVGYDFRDNGFGYFSEDMVGLRYDADGKLDTTFGDGGEVSIDFTSGSFGYADDDYAYGVTTDANGNIYIVGSHSANFGFSTGDSDFAIAKLNAADGSLDTNWGFNGKQTVDIDLSPIGGGYNDEARDAIVDASGRLVVVGSRNQSGNLDVAMVRLDTLGQPDDNFGSFGQAAFDAGGDETASAVGLQTNGSNPEKIVVAGQSNGDFLLARFNDDGSIDTSFSGGGYGYSIDEIVTGTEEGWNDLAIDSNNNIFTVGQSSFASRNQFFFNPSSGTSGVIGKYTPSGVLQTSRVLSPDVPSTLTSVVIDPASSKPIVAGANDIDFIWGQLDANTLDNDSSFNGGNFVNTDFTPPESSEFYDLALEVAVTSDGKVVLGGATDTCGDGCIQTSVARYGVQTGTVDDAEDIDDFISYEELHAKPPAEPLNSRLKNLSEGALLYVLAQPDDQGRATIDLTSKNDVIGINFALDENGTPTVFVIVNNISIPYEAATTTQLTFNLGGGADFLTTGPGVNVNMLVIGGDGNDTITTGSGSDAVFGGDGADVVHGGDGPDLILGGLGRDTLFGETDRDLLIGGVDKDVLDGGTNEDILIGGTTAYDNNGAALNGILTEWTQLTPNSTRIDNIRNGGGINGTFVLKVGVGATVFDDGAKDNLTGGTERDWFFRRNTGTTDSILDNITGEEVDNV
ncbi:MAG TPA: hypothetical protein VL282_19350, partial [Tepidisphaeraceae bacterium]|nr:hypothetical protein [Tepidisphaeraceae bacterium]